MMPPPSSHQWAYDVYVSFRVEDIRKTFMDHFFTAFKRLGIHVYEENDQLNREEACIEHYKVIEQSRFLIVVFSHNYALSIPCLKELVKILECKEWKKERCEVWPIFYDVKPSVVRNQTGSYKEAMMKHEASDKTEVVKWKRALTIAGNLSGQDLQDTTNGFLCNKTLREWGYEIDKLESGPHALIQKVLQISYDELDADQKNIFLDIACFFNGEKKDYVVKILDVCEPFFTTNLRVLVDKSLVTIREDRIHMHNLVQEMGRQIVREESKDPGKRSRLWSPTDVLDVLINDKGTELVKGLALDLSCSDVNISCQSLTKLKNLRLLNIYRTLNYFRDTSAIPCKVGTASGQLEYLSSELQFLCWHGYPFQHLPSLFCPESLLVLDMSYSCIKQIWNRSKGFKELTLLKLSHCRNISKTPDFTGTPNLKELMFDGCENLVVIHPSIGTLKMLILLNLENCKNLRILPSIAQLESLENLIFSGCPKMENLVGIHPSWHSFFSLTYFLRRIGCLPALVLSSLSTLGVLRVLDVSHCNLSGASLRHLETLCSLEELNMSGNEFTNIDANLSQLSRLSCLRMVGCKKLQFLPKLPSSILNLDAQHCTSLQELPKLSAMYCAGCAVFDFKNCPKVVEKQAIENLLTTFLPQGWIDIFEKVHVFLSGSRIPGWFSDQVMGDCIKVDLPPHWCYEKLKGLATCAVISPQNHGSRSTYFEIFCTVKDFHGDVIGEVSLLATDDPNIESDQVWLCYRKSDFRWKKAENHIMVSFKSVGINCKVKHCGVRFVCEEDEQEAANGLHMITWFHTSTAKTDGAGNLNLDVGSVTIEHGPQRKKFRVL
uniref:disease resistance protein Roq1-like isoform X2 n=1 Tax=Erigeron canadensis TaxID=72917 RepID=UPI001CB8B0D6|nr:disease resistance protein Roq1-like isoform X2 [Erigeron canadensis]